MKRSVVAVVFCLSASTAYAALSADTDSVSPVQNEPAISAGEELPVAAAMIPPVLEDIRFLPHGEQSLAARILAIRAAKSSIDIITYDFEPCDSSTKVLIDELAKRAKDIPVRIIIDGNDLKPDSKKYALTSYLYTKNIGLRIFNENPNPTHLNRSHAKGIFIDVKTAKPTYFVGGRNLTDEYFGMSSEMNFFDQDLQITGHSGIQAGKAYEAVWNVGTQPYGASDTDLKAFENNCMHRSNRDELVAKYMEENTDKIYASLKPYSCGSITYALDDPSSPFTDMNQMTKKHTTNMVTTFIKYTETSLNMTNQYYMPLDVELTNLGALRDSKKANLSVSIYTNNIGDATQFNELMTKRMAEAVQRDNTGKMKVKPISSLGGLRDHDAGILAIPHAPWRIHTKTYVRDHRDVIVSSFNLDQLSYQDNLESAAMVPNCPDLAADMEAEYKKLEPIYQADKKNCAACAEETKNLGPDFPGPWDLIHF